MKIELRHISIGRIIDADNLSLHVEYLRFNDDGLRLDELPQTDTGQYLVSANSYYPAIDLDKDEAEYEALQEAVENRG